MLFKETYGGRSIPQTYLLDRDGKIAYSHLGWSAGDQGKIEQEIERLLKS